MAVFSFRLAAAGLRNADYELKVAGQRPAALEDAPAARG